MNDPKLYEIIQRIIKIIPVNTVFLFGSRAKGTFSVSSDYDLLIISTFNLDQRGTLIDKFHDSLWGVKASVDILLLTQDEFEKESTVINTISEVVKREGIEVYAA